MKSISGKVCETRVLTRIRYARMRNCSYMSQPCVRIIINAHRLED